MSWNKSWLVKACQKVLRCRTTCCDARVKRNMSDGRRNGSSWSWRISRKGTRGTRAPLAALAMRLIPYKWHLAPETLWCPHVKCSHLWAVLRQQLIWPKEIHTPLWLFSLEFEWFIFTSDLTPESPARKRQKNCKLIKLWTSRFSALRTWRSACLWKALRSQRSGNASWPRNRSASTEDGELDHKKRVQEIQMSTKSNKSTTETVAASIVQTWLRFWLCEWCGPVLVLYLQDKWSNHIKSPHLFTIVSLSTASALCTSSIPIFGSHLWSWSVDFRAETFSKSTTAKTKSALVKENKASKITNF